MPMLPTEWETFTEIRVKRVYGDKIRALAKKYKVDIGAIISELVDFYEDKAREGKNEKIKSIRKTN